MHTAHTLAMATLLWAGLASSEPPSTPAPKEPVPGSVLAWHKAGYKGKGVKVAILDSGFKGYRAALGTVLPSTVTARSFRKDGKLEARDSQHGILCAEIIHRLAPEAELLFANWEPECPEAFLQAVEWAVGQGARVISCSMIMPTWSDGEGGGPTHARLKHLLGKEVLLFASAGNTAQRHWGGAFAPDADGWHEWEPGQDSNPLRPTSGDRVSVELVHREGEFDLVVEDLKSGDVLGRAASSGNKAVVRLEPKGETRFAVRVRRTDRAEAGKPAPTFHLTILGGKLGMVSRAGSIPFPGDGAEVVAVAAVDGKLRRMSYSSCGPLTSGPKPDLCAAVPVTSVWRPGQAFAGTSAAAPQAAGMAALLTGTKVADVRGTLEKSARKAKPGHCAETGYGLVGLPAPR